LREAEGLAERLSVAEVSVAGLLRPRQYAGLLRDAFDPFGARGRARTALGEPEGEGVDPALLGPLAAQESWAWYRTDSAFHAAYWIASWPRSDVGPMFLAPLLMQTEALRAVAVTIEPVPYPLAMRRAEAAQTAEIAEEINRTRQGFVSTARNRRRAQAASRREEELADGHAEMRFAGFVRTSAPDLRALEAAESEIEHAAALARLDLQRLYGEQEAGFRNTLALCGGLR
ncbi:MAG TPA: SCO6880 family protein, partial [Solirubrobacterales bacterium]